MTAPLEIRTPLTSAAEIVGGANGQRLTEGLKGTLWRGAETLHHPAAKYVGVATGRCL